MRRLFLAALAVLAFGGAAVAQNFPSRPITIIVPFSAGGPSDVMARILAERMKTTLGEVVQIENVTGAGGSIGVGRAVRSAAGRLHHQLRPSRHPCRQRRDLQQARLRPRHRSRAGGAAAEQHHDRRQQERGAGEIAGRIAGVAEGEARAGGGRHRRRRIGQSHRRALFRERHRHQAAICAVSRHRAGHERPRRRTDRYDRRSALQFDQPGARRKHPRLCRHRYQALGIRRRHPDRRRGGPARISHDAVVGPVGAEGYAEGNRHQAECRRRRGAERSGGAQAARKPRPADDAEGQADARSAR